MKKTICVLTLCAGLLSACKNPTAIEFDVNAPQLKDGVFVVKDLAGQTIYGANIKDGKCTVKDVLAQPGFYQLDIQKATSNDKHAAFEVYLEPTTYTVTANHDLDRYPDIGSDSKNQQELSIYYPLLDKYNARLRRKEQQLTDEQTKAAADNNADKYRTLSLELLKVRQANITEKIDALNDYIKQHPESEMASHFMWKQNYDDYPKMYVAIYSKLSAAAKASPDGIEIAEKLKHLLKLLPDSIAPKLEGDLFDGRSREAALNGKKLILIDFWRAGSPVSRTNREDIKPLYAAYAAKGFGVISVSLDDRPLWWKTAVSDDHLPWPQMSDLKGDDSPNATNYNISSLPTYYIVDAHWRVVAADVPITSIGAYVTEYFDKHH